jgi:hypothetical protein
MLLCISLACSASPPAGEGLGLPVGFSLKEVFYSFGSEMYPAAELLSYIYSDHVVLYVHTIYRFQRAVCTSPFPVLHSLYGTRKEQRLKSDNFSHMMMHLILPRYVGTTSPSPSLSITESTYPSSTSFFPNFL